MRVYTSSTMSHNLKGKCTAIMIRASRFAHARLTAMSHCCAARQNFNVVRIFGFPVQKGFNLQTSAGVYNEYAFTGLDKVISEASKAGLKLIIALTNNWSYNNLQTDWKCEPHSPLLSQCYLGAILDGADAVSALHARVAQCMWSKSKTTQPRSQTTTC